MPPALTEVARAEEIDFVDSIRLLDVCPSPAGEKVIGTIWVDTNKGDEQSPVVRSRLVAQEVKRAGSLEHYFAATPPLSSLKLLLSIAVTAVLPRREAIYAKKGACVIQFLDVKKAHFWATAERVLFVELSPRTTRGSTV